MSEEQAAFNVGAPQQRRFTILELVKCAERELQMRKQVYPRRVQDGRMSRGMADREAGMMAAIVELLRKKAEAEGLVLRE
jgi:hypothetical protein